MMYTSIPVWFLVLGAALCAPERVQNEPDHAGDASDASHAGHEAPLEKRSPQHEPARPKRAYSYVSEYKRLPVYNFGLGKRSRPYSFGLGKRSVENAPLAEPLTEQLAEQLAERLEQLPAAERDALAQLVDQYDDDTVYEKRARPYSFGLGKRSAEDDELFEEKRARQYDFGLGKRRPQYDFGLGKRTRNYNFGLGKRLSSKFNFGLGKRQPYSFGIGKRAADESFDDAAPFDV